MWKTFITAVVGGSIAAALLPTALIAMMLLASMLTNSVHLNDLGPAIGLLLLPFGIAVPVIAASSLLIGIPLTRGLRRLGWESALTYTVAGGWVGCAIPLLWSGITTAGRFDPWSALLGSIGGAVTSRIWCKGIRRER